MTRQINLEQYLNFSTKYLRFSIQYIISYLYSKKLANWNVSRPPEDLWSFFDDFSSEHVAAMAPCLYHYDTPRNKVPHYGQTGLNAGIMHMDLARMRDIPDGWTRATMAMHDKFKKQIKLADQVRVRSGCICQ